MNGRSQPFPTPPHPAVAPPHRSSPPCNFFEHSLIAGDSPDAVDARRHLLVAGPPRARSIARGVGQINGFFVKHPHRLGRFQIANAVMTMIGAPRCRPTTPSPSPVHSRQAHQESTSISTGGQMNFCRCGHHRVPHPAHQPRQAPRDRWFVINN